jgi:hypothetical protein
MGPLFCPVALNEVTGNLKETPVPEVSILLKINVEMVSSFLFSA